MIFVGGELVKLAHDHQDLSFTPRMSAGRNALCPLAATTARRQGTDAA